MRRIRWIRYETPQALARAWAHCIAKDNGWPAKGAKAHPGLLPAIVRQGMWAFVSVRTKVPVIRYWHKLGVPHEQVAMMLGHELGHVTGKPARGHAAEEDRADEYGKVAAAVFRRLTRSKR